MRIVHAIPFFDPATRFGGPVTQLRRLCRRLAERGHEIEVVTTELDIGPNLPRERWLEKDGYRIWYGRLGWTGRAAPYHAPRLRRPLEEALAEADVLHLDLSFTHANVLASRIATARGVPYVYSARSCLDPVRLAERRWLKRGFLGLFEREIIRKATLIHALTDTEAAQIAAQGARPEQLVVVPNASEFDASTAWPDPSRFRAHLGLDADVPLILFLGRLQRIKGLDLLVQAFATVRRTHPGARLVVAGPDEGGRAIVHAQSRMHGVAGAVHLPGRLDGELRMAALRAADVFALSSYSEGMPNAVLEACAAGTPVVITDRCNLPEVAEAGAGRVVEADADAFATALHDLLADPQRRGTMGERGQRLVADRFALDPVADGFERLYERAIGQTAGTAARSPRPKIAAL